MSFLGFGHRVRKSGELARPLHPEVAAHPAQTLVRSAPFEFVPEQSAGNVDMFRKSPQVSLHKELIESYDAAGEALRAVDLLGLRAEVIVSVDDSWSIKNEWPLVLRMLVRLLGYALHFDTNGIQVVVYGRYNEDPILVTKDNYLQIATLIKPTFGGTPMTEVFQKTLRMAEASGKFTLRWNITDGDPNDHVTMSQTTIVGSGHPVQDKHFMIKMVPYMETIDDMPSQFEIRKHPDGRPVTDANGMLVIDRNPAGKRLVDNVDCKAIDPVRATNAQFAAAIADELNPCIEVQARVGLLTGVPNVARIF